MTVIVGTGIRFDSVAQSPRGPIPNPTITVCTSAATGLPCSPQVLTYTDATLSVACPASTQVVLTNTSTCVATGDGLGNFGVWLPPGDYIYTITGPSISSQSYALTLNSNGASFVGPSPWIDVTSSAYGAKCDGVTDDTTAINNAVTAANALGSNTFVFFPPKTTTCIVNGTFNWNNFSGIRIGGLGGFPNNLSKPSITYTGTAATFLTCRGCVGVVFQNIGILYNNAAFAGNLVDTQGASNAVLFDSVLFSGTSTAKTATWLAFAGQGTRFTNCTFNWSVGGINGGNGAGNFGSIKNCYFNSPSGTISGTYVFGTSQGWEISGNQFEMFNAPNTAVIWDTTGVGQFGGTFSNNWIGDAPAAYTGTMLKLTQGTTLIGNTITGPSGAAATLASINAAGDGVMFGGGNAILGSWSTIFSHAGTPKNFVVLGNDWTSATITTFMSGVPGSGIVQDNGNTVKIYGSGLTTASPLQMISNGQFGFLMSDTSQGVNLKSWDFVLAAGSLLMRGGPDSAPTKWLQVDNSVSGPTRTAFVSTPVDFTEIAAPAGLASNSRLYADSTAHKLELSNNNGSFFPVAQVLTATSAAFATATTAGTCVQSTTAVTGAATTMSCTCAPVSTPGVGAQWSCFVSSAGNVTINECAVATSAGGTIAFNIRLTP